MSEGSNSSDRRRVLIIEDNPADARLLEVLVEQIPEAGFQMEHVGSLAAGLERLAGEGIELIMVDLSLPDSHGWDSFARVHDAAPDKAIIVMSGLDDEDLAIKTVQEGAQDYLVKGQVDSRLLVRSMHYAIERKRVEEALAKERDLLHTLLDNLPDRIYVKDRQSRFLRISRALADIFKLEHPRQAWLKSDLDFFSPEHAREALKDEQHVMATGQPIIGKIEQETLPDGRASWALTSKLPLRDKHGAIIGTFGLSRDITELKAFEDQLARERNLLRSLIDNLPDYIYVKDPQGRYVIDNIAHQRFLGANHLEEVTGKTSFDFFEPDLAQRFTEEDDAVIRTGHPIINREDQIVDRGGRPRWHATTRVPLRNSAGAIEGLVGIGRDVTERKNAEEQLRKAHSELQKSHQELKSAQYQLIEAEKMQSIGRLAAGVAHEVKNPLAILRMGVDYFAGSLKAEDKDAALIINDMADAIKRADAIIMGLLDFSVPAAMDIHPRDLNQIINQSIALVRHEMATCGVRLDQDLDPTMPEVWFDQNKIKQVLVNIFTNAVHAMPSGGTLSVRSYSRLLEDGEIDTDLGSRLANRFHAGDRVAVLEVTDTGSGISEEKLAMIFDPFFTTKPTGKGTGLGLTVTKKIVELHGGTIDLRNRKEGGVMVTIVFRV